ncbi:MAG: CotH kinase family protein [Polyangiales bacterium]
MSLRALPLLASVFAAFVALSGCTPEEPYRCPEGVQCLVITEISAAGTEHLDDDGTVQDWAEIYNIHDQAMPVGGYQLTDGMGEAGWRIPERVLQPGEYLVVFLSRKNRRGETLHTDFALDADGEYLGLIAPDGAIESSIDTYPEQRFGISYGRAFASGAPTEDLRFFPSPTPGAANGAGTTDIDLPEVRFDPPGQTFTGSLMLTLSTDDEDDDDAVIHYTLDGTLPDEASPVADGPIEITGPVTVRARATDDSFTGPLAGESYLRVTENVAAFTSDLPVAIARFPEAIDAFDEVRPGEYYEGIMNMFVPGDDGRTMPVGIPSFGGEVAFRGRGYSSQWFDKKQFTMEARDLIGQDRDVELLGMPADGDWVLNAPWSDKSLMRNRLALGLAAGLGGWAPRTEFFEMFLAEEGEVVTQADYVGVYLAIEKIERGNDRIDIDRLGADDDDITGGYIVVIDRVDPGDRGFRSSGGAYMAFVEPSEERITDPQREYIVGYINELEERVERADFGAYEELIDVDSVIDQHLLIELTRNVDGLRLSTYLYKDRGGKLRMGPAWDYNLSMGNSAILNGWTTNGWQHAQFDAEPPATEMCNCPVTTSSECEVGCAPLWIKRLFMDPVFQARYRARWAELRDGAWSDANILGSLDANILALTESQERNFARWDVLGRRTFGNPPDFIAATWTEELEYLRSFLTGRLAWMDSQLLD